MCNHFQLNTEALDDWAMAQAIEKTAIIPDIPTDIWPKRIALVARNAGDKREFASMSWGVPMTVPGKRSGTHIIKYVTNVRNLASPFWKPTLAKPSQRCLVPFSRFAEPKPGKDPETGRPAEHWFGVADAPIAAFAGIWRSVENLNVFSFLTCEPNNLVKPFHPKAMPLILMPDDYECWLEGSYDDVVALQAPFPSQLMKVLSS